MESISSLGLGENITAGLVYFPLGFSQLCSVPTKGERGGRPYNFTGMKTLNTFYILLYRKELNSLLLCDMDYLYLPYFVFANGTCVIMFCIFASFKQIRTTKYTGLVSHDRKRPEK